ncbi:hypothetical protein [Caldiplasma sukawensis]
MKSSIFLWRCSEITKEAKKKDLYNEPRERMNNVELKPRGFILNISYSLLHRNSKLDAGREIIKKILG